MSHVFPRQCNKEMPVATAGEGIYLIDQAGKRYLDACGGAAVSCLGHSNQHVIDSVREQLGSIAYAHTGFFSSEPAERLARRLSDRAPGTLDHVYFVCGGSEAIEASIKLARQYFLEKGEPERRHVIARKQSYHGNTLGALSAGGNEWRREQFQPLLSGAMTHIDACYYYRGAEPGESRTDYGRRMADQLEAEIRRLGEGTVAAFLAEPVVGATLGAVTAEDGYFARIRDICSHYGVLFIADEVMCGMGRTGDLFAMDHDNVQPDMVCIAKGLGAGVQPVGAMLCTTEIYQTIAKGSGFFQHGHTYLGHPAACAAGNAVLDEFDRMDLVNKVRQNGPVLIEKLQHALGNHPNVGDIRGRGHFLGVELVKDRHSREPLDAANRTHAKIKQAAMDNGLMIYPMGGTLDGRQGDHILLAPPFILTEADMDEMIGRLGEAIRTVLPG